MLLNILWQCGLVLSLFVNIPMSGLAYMKYRLKDKEFYNHLKNRSLKDKIMFNIKNVIRFVLPIYNIIYPIKLLCSGGLSGVMNNWKKEILTSEKNKGRFGRGIKNFINKVKTEVKEFKDEFFPKKNKEASKEVKTVPTKEGTKKVEAPKKEQVEVKKPVQNEVKKTVPTKKETTTSSSLTSADKIDFYLDHYRKEYFRLRNEYEALKKQNAPVSQINEVVNKMNAIALRSQQLIDLRKGKSETRENNAQMKLKR